MGLPIISLEWLKLELGFLYTSVPIFFIRLVNDVINCDMLIFGLQIKARLDMHEMPVFLVEDIWQAVQGPTTLVELAVEQKEANTRLVEHHYVFCILLHAILVYSLKSVKPLSLYDTKVLGRNFLCYSSYNFSLVLSLVCVFDVSLLDGFNFLLITF